jgi:two-component system phosphate regulon sensor histidine kinase PhoR
MVEYLDTIRSCNQEMSDFISTLLNISRIESDSVFWDNDPLDAGIEINKLLDDLKMEIDDKDLIVKREIDSPLPIIIMDEKLFHLIIRNLLTNAVHYTPEKGEITISAYKKGAYLELCVADTGIGIPEQDQDKIFEKMYRSSNASINKTKGSGLGLYIAKNMADKVGAKIIFESREGQGTKFFVRFPLLKGESTDDNAN